MPTASYLTDTFLCDLAWLLCAWVYILNKLSGKPKMSATACNIQLHNLDFALFVDHVLTYEELYHNNEYHVSRFQLNVRH